MNSFLTSEAAQFTKSKNQYAVDPDQTAFDSRLLQVRVKLRFAEHETSEEARQQNHFISLLKKQMLKVISFVNGFQQQRQTQLTVTKMVCDFQPEYSFQRQETSFGLLKIAEMKLNQLSRSDLKLLNP